MKQTGKGIKCVRDDKGGEYSSREYLTFLENHGIRHEVTAPNAPSQNGIAERFNRTFEEAVTCMFEDAKKMCERAKLPLNFWWEALCAYIYVDDRLPTSTLKGITPYEAWWGVKPSIDRIRVWGCKAYVFKEKTERKPFEPKSKTCTFIGYEPDSKVWRFWNPASRKVIKSRNAIFDETLNENAPVKDTVSPPQASVPVSKPSVTILDDDDDDSDSEDELLPLQTNGGSPTPTPSPPLSRSTSRETVGAPRRSDRQRRSPDPEFYKVKNPKQYRSQKCRGYEIAI